MSEKQNLSVKDQAKLDNELVKVIIDDTKTEKVRLEKIKYLVNLGGADINSFLRISDGGSAKRTVLWLAVSQGKKDVFKFLLDICRTT